jgi:hypothetical protein
VSEKTVRIIGWLGLFFGIITAVCSPLPGKWAAITILSTIPGFLFSSLYIMHSAKLGVKNKWIHPGYIGLLLTSTPIILAILAYINK